MRGTSSGRSPAAVGQLHSGSRLDIDRAARRSGPAPARPGLSHAARAVDSGQAGLTTLTTPRPR
jgi:hypothetical protein